MKKSLLSILSLTLILSSCALPSDPFTKVLEQDEQFRKTLPASNTQYTNKISIKQQLMTTYIMGTLFAFH